MSILIKEDFIMKTKRETRQELEDQVLRARKWFASPWRTAEETTKWYPEYEKIINKINKIEKEMWGPIPW
jgi:hypothetical protein